MEAEALVSVTVNGYQMELFQQPDQRNVDFISNVLEIDLTNGAMLVSIQGYDWWRLARLQRFEESKEYEIITTPISQPLNSFTMEDYVEIEEWEGLINALPFFKRLSFFRSAVESEEEWHDLSNAINMSNRLQKLSFYGFDGPIMLNICAGLGVFGNLNSIDISQTYHRVGDAMCERLGQYIESSRFIRSIKLSRNWIGYHGCVSILNGIKRRPGERGKHGDLLDIDLSINEIGVSGLLAILEFFQAGYSARFNVESNKMPEYHGEQKLEDMTLQYVKKGYLHCKFGDAPEQESKVNQYVQREVNVKVSIMSDLTIVDGLEVLARGAFGTVYRLDDETAVKVTNPITEKSGKRNFRELELWAMVEDCCVRLKSMGCKREGESVQFMYVMKRYDGNLIQFLQRMGELELEKCLHILESISDDLHVLHDKYGIIHRDLHSGNVLFSGDKGDCFSISDLGLSVLESDLVSCGEEEYLYFNTMGSYSTFAEHIRPPEFVSCGVEKIGYSTDIYAFGILMFQVLTGKDITTYSESGTSIPGEISRIRQTIKNFDADDQSWGISEEHDDFFHSERRKEKLLIELMLRCSEEDPNKRPTAFQLKFCFAICRHQDYSGFKELCWDKKGNLRASSARDGTIFISKKKGSSWIAATTRQINDSWLIRDLQEWNLPIFDSGSLLFFEDQVSDTLTGWDCSGQPNNMHIDFGF
eukprot:TRINITY_DN2335_c0_g1_i1.p1 TRINITY_DN2335_c0_g1~~TRINITY_DN2335_c0_g1_i1.p1  ORF type:complete len:722 (-),score=129.54 TRINITY_DN2335_c0_g1_i1:53-2155(-)